MKNSGSLPLISPIEAVKKAGKTIPTELVHLSTLATLQKTYAHKELEGDKTK